MIALPSKLPTPTEGEPVPAASEGEPVPAAGEGKTPVSTPAVLAPPVPTPALAGAPDPSIPGAPTPAIPDDAEALGDEIARLAAHLHAATYQLLVLIRAFDEREAWGWGFRSCAHWLSWRVGISLGPAREKVRVARALGSLPRISGAMARGELSYSKVRALSRVATPENEEDLLSVARHATAAHIETLVRAWRRVDRLEEARDERRRHERRYLYLFPGDDGSYVLQGRLDPEVGAVLKKALEWASEALYRKEVRARARGDGGDGGRAGADRGNPGAATDDAEANGGSAGAAIDDSDGSGGSAAAHDAEMEHGAVSPSMEEGFTAYEQRWADAVGLVAEGAMVAAGLEAAAEGRESGAQAEEDGLEPFREDGLDVSREDGLDTSRKDGLDVSEVEREAESDSKSSDAGRAPEPARHRADRFQVVLHVDAEALRESRRDGATDSGATDSGVSQIVVGARSSGEVPSAGAGSSGGASPAAGAVSSAPAASSTFSRGHAILADSGYHVSAETSRRLACDGSLVPMIHDSEGRVLDVGRKRRTVPPAIRRALDHRDGGCRFPGCGCRYTDAHHIVHWADGGETRLDNLLLLCRRHHRAVHEEGFRVEVVGDGPEVRFFRPDGREVAEAPPSPGLPADAVGAMMREHERQGIVPDAWTPTPDWHGEPLDCGLALDMLRPPKSSDAWAQGAWPGPEDGTGPHAAGGSGRGGGPGMGSGGRPRLGSGSETASDLRPVLEEPEEDDSSEEWLPVFRDR